MTVTETALPGVLVLEPRVFGDARGFFCETYHAERYRQAGVDAAFVQDNLSRSGRGTLRGLHFQAPPHAQAKLVQVLEGAVWDVAVDLRRDSPTFGQHVGVELSAENGRQVYVPVGFAHGFCVTSETALFAYKCSAFYAPGAEGSLRWDDPDLAIGWPVEAPVLSDKDRAAPRLADVDSPFAYSPPEPAGVQQVPYDERFLDSSWQWLQDPEIRRLTDTPVFSRQQQREWFDGLGSRSDYSVWGVEVDGQPVGAFGIKNVKGGEAEYWGYLGERAQWGRGIGQWMLRQTLAEARERGLSQLVLRVVSENVRAQRAYERFGFKVTSESDGQVRMALPVQ